ncbi:MAG: spermidine synthase [Archaeoglobaceae archaeon]|nr:spermidine synthase [Archaeoglobaceae archaeon]MDW7989718.1 spermidine synthase [Archaeoglobaceae archaeon]
MEFIEKYDGCGLVIKIRKKLAEATKIQKVEIFETESLGKMLVIDGKVQVTEFDEHIYHEMLVHVPMNSCKDARSVLIVGGGDGGALREALKHDLEKVVLVEIDRNVIELCKKFLKIENGAFDDPRVEIVFEDGKKYVESCEKFDVIIVDGTDPVGVSDPLFGRDFFELCAEKCKVFCSQSQSPIIQRDLFRKMLQNSSVIKNRSVFISAIPTYPLAIWSFIIGGDFSFKYVERKFKRIMGKTRHYNPEVHFSAFILPEWLKEEIRNAGRG